MFQKIISWLKYWYTINAKGCSYPEVCTLKNVICSLPPVKIGDMNLARGMKNIYFTKEEFEAQGKITVGKPIKFLVSGCIIKASNKALAKEIIINGLEANAYSTINIEKTKHSCFCTIQPYSI